MRVELFPAPRLDMDGLDDGLLLVFCATGDGPVKCAAGVVATEAVIFDTLEVTIT
jgi:hypothetical protein